MRSSSLRQNLFTPVSFRRPKEKMQCFQWAAPPGEGQSAAGCPLNGRPARTLLRLNSLIESSRTWPRLRPGLAQSKPAVADASLDVADLWCVKNGWRLGMTRSVGGCNEADDPRFFLHLLDDLADFVGGQVRLGKTNTVETAA